MKRNNRASNIELLRILCMIAIILYHNAVWGDIPLVALV